MPLQFQQGDIVKFVYFPEEEYPQYTIKGNHPALILHDHTLPNNTIIVSPLSSLYDDHGNEKKLKSYHLRLYKKDYPGLTHDSYVKLDQLFTFSRNKVTGTKIGHLSDKDRAAMHLKLIEALQMQSTINVIVEKYIERAVRDVLNEYIKKHIYQNQSQD